MSRLPGRGAVGERLSGEAGYSLPELLVALMIGMLVAFGATSVVMMAVKAQPRTTEKAAQIQQGRTMTERLVRELRQGEEVTEPNGSGPPTASALEVLTLVQTSSCGASGGGSSMLCRVIYECGGTVCTRAERQPDGSGTAPAEEVVRGISTPEVFSYQTSETGLTPNYVGVELVFPGEDGAEAVTVADGAGLRNWSPTPEGE